MAFYETSMNMFVLTLYFCCQHSTFSVKCLLLFLLNIHLLLTKAIIKLLMEQYMVVIALVINTIQFMI